jgi:hypothetical protein
MTALLKMLQSLFACPKKPIKLNENFQQYYTKQKNPIQETQNHSHLKPNKHLRHPNSRSMTFELGNEPHRL